MEIYAQQGNRFLVKTKEEGLISFGYLVDLDEETVSDREINLFSMLRRGYWEPPSISKAKEEVILSLVNDVIIK